MKKYILGALGAFIGFLILAAVGSSSDIDLVKNGTLKFDKTLSVGDAIDNYKYCDTPVVWKSFTSDQGREIVEASCETTSMYKTFLENEIKSLLSSIKDFEKRIDKLKSRSSDYKYEEKTMAEYTEKASKYQSMLDKAKEILTIQFAINKSGDSFQVAYIGLSRSDIDGNMQELTYNTVALKSIYANESLYYIGN